MPGPVTKPRPARAILAAIALALNFACSTDSLLQPSQGGRPLFSLLPTGTTETLLADGLSSPTGMAIAPDGRVLIAEQCGNLQVVKDGALLPTPMLTLTVDCVGERGLLGVAVDPDFANNHRVFIYHTVPTAPVHNRVSLFIVNGDVAVGGSLQAILDLDDLGTSTSHNGGALHFGPDGTLYVAVGDNETSSNSQTLNNLLGKILRINVDGSIPTDNPFFATATGRNRAIWALGFRNPFTFAFQPGTGRLFVNDVGELQTEEIDDVIGGANYGWPSCEGPCSPANPNFRDPLFAYDHSLGCAITGGTFYNPVSTRFPNSFIGKYFFADFCGGWIHALDPGSRTVSSFSDGLTFPVDLQVSVDGGLFYLQRGNGSATGQLWRVDGTASQAPVVTQHPANVLVSVGQSASFSVSATGTSPLGYQWQRDGVDISGATATSYTLASAALSDSAVVFRCVITNPFGGATSNGAVLTVTTNQPPTANITAPVPGTLYQGGQTFTYSGTGDDPETGPLPPSAFTWEVVFHHNTHTHPFLAPTSGATSGSFVIPSIGEVSANVYYAILLTVKDPAGLSQTFERDILPETSTLTLGSNPSGAQLTLDGQPVVTPMSVLGVVGIQRTLGVVTPQTIGTGSYQFTSWSDAGAATHSILTPSGNPTYTANFSAFTPPPSSDVTFVQENAGTGSGVATISIALPASTAAGNLIVVGIDRQTAGFSAISDGQGNGFTQVGSEVMTAGGVRTRLYYARNVRGGAETVTVSLPGSDPSLQVYVAEYHGADAVTPLDASVSSTGVSGSVTSGPVGTSGPNDLLVAFCVSDGSCSAGSGFAARSTHSGNLLEDRAVGAAGTYTATASSSNGWAMIVAAFRPQGGGGPPPPTPVTASVTAANKVYDGTTTATINSCTLSGNPSGVTCSAAAANFSDAAVGANKTVTATGITLGGPNAANYSLTSTTATTTASITSSPQTPVTASVTAADKGYDGTTAATITSCTLSGNPSGVTCSAAAASFPSAAAGPNKTVTATGITLGGPNAANYTLTSTTATSTASITPAPVTASVTAANKVYDGTTTATITGCTLSGNPPGVTCGAAAGNFSDPAVGNNKTVTATGITLGGANAANYGLTSTTATTTASITSAPPVSVTFVQANAGTGSGVATVSISLPAGTVAGNLIVVGIDRQIAGFNAISDGQGNAYTQVGTEIVTAGGVRTRLYYARNIRGGAETVTVSLPGSDPSLQVYVAEYKGADTAAPLDASVSSTGVSGSVTSGPVGTTGPSDMLVAFCVSDGSCTAGSGFAARSTHSGNLLEDRILGAAGTYTATASSSNGWAMIVAAFRPQGGGGPPPPTPVTASVTAADKVYDGTTAATITGCTLSGNPSGVTCSAASGAFASATAGNNKTVTASGITLGGPNAANYSLTSTTATTTASITPASVTAGVTAVDKAYDGTTTASTSCTLSGNPAGVTCSAAAANFPDAAVGANKAVSATGISLAGANAGNYALTSTTATTSASITPASVTASVTAANKVYDGTTTASIIGCILSGNPSGVTCSAAAASFSDAAVGNNKTVTATGITLGGANSANYTLTASSATTAASITSASPTPVTASVTAADKVYDGTTTAAVTACTLSGNPSGVTCGAAAAGFADAQAGANKTVTATGISLGGPNASDYTLTSTTATTTASITTAPLTASVTAANKVYDGSATATITTCSLSGNPAGVTCSSTAGSFSSATVGTNKTVTATGITLGGANAGNYSLTSTSATTTASITAAPVTASVAAADKVYDGTTTATITSCTLSGNPTGVTCSAAAANFSDPAVGNNKTVTATGITLGGANSGNYSLTSSTAATTASITPAPTGSVTFVQANAGTGRGVATVAIPLSASTGVGNLIVVGIDRRNAGFGSVTDGQGNAYTQIGTEIVTAGGVRTRLYYARNIRGGAETVTVSLPASDPSLQVYVAEYKGASTTSPLDVNSTRTGTTTSVTSAPVVTTGPNDMLVAFCVSDGTCSVGTNFRARSTHSGNLLEDRAVTTAGSYTATGTSSNGWAIIVAAFRP